MWSAAKKNEDMQVAKEHATHKNRLLEIKPRVNTNPPKEQPHVKTNLKSKAIKSSQISTIHAENQLLLQKMVSINTRTPQFHKLSENFSAKSLNDYTRAQLLTKITEENQQLLSRLQGIKPNYNFKKYSREFKFKKYLSQKLSENSRRIPRISSFGLTPSFENTRTPVRPETAPAKLPRPPSSNGTNSRPNYLDL